jgi:flagellar hook-associated protein 3 FlgL
VAHKTEQSNLEDLDMIEGISDFQNKQTGLQVALQSYAQVQRLSLFQYIG